MTKHMLMLALALGLMTPMHATTLPLFTLDHNPEEIDRKAQIILRGHIVDASTGESVVGAQITVVGSSLGTVTNKDGAFILRDVPRAKVLLRVKSLGYATTEYTVEKVSEPLTIRIKQDAFNMNEVVVSANRSETRRQLAGTLVNVTTPELFAATQSVSLDQALKFNPGIRIEDNCQNCGFNQVRINGLDGSYSQILINSRSIFGALASVYGLEMLPTSMIDRVEVVRGGGSALFGSSAIGGTINIITKAPMENMASAAYNIEMFQDNWKKPMHDGSFFSALVSDDHKAGITLFGRMKHRDAIDLVRPGSKVPADKELGTQAGQDGFSELPRLYSNTIGTSAFLTPSSEGRLTLDYFYTQEERRGGDRLDRPEHEAQIAESLRHKWHTGILKYTHNLFDGAGLLSGFGAVSSVVRNSYYGGGDLTSKGVLDGTLSKEDIAAALSAYGLTKDLTMQAGLQYVHTFDQLLFMPAELTVGYEYNYNALSDASGYRPADIKQKVHTHSAILQNEWRNETFGLLAGLRYDRTNMNPGSEDTQSRLQHLNIITPRLTLRYNPTEKVNLRAGYAEGFRAPQYFDEELHVEFAGGEGVPRVLSPDLKEERSRTFTGSIDYYFDLGELTDVNFMVEAFYTRLSDKFNTEDRGSYKEVVNSGRATVKGLNMELRLDYAKRLNLQAGFTVQSSRYAEPVSIGIDELKSDRFMRTPDTYGYFVFGWKPFSGFTFNLSGDYSGKMLVGHEAGEPVEPYITIRQGRIENAPSFFTFGTKLSYKFTLNLQQIEVNCGVSNLLNSYQRDFDEGPQRASAYVYGPKTPRTVYAGVRFTI